MRKSYTIIFAAMLWLSGTASVRSQDFLKQLEEKIFQKQQESKNKEPADKAKNKEPSEKDRTDPAQPVEAVDPPSLLEPEGLPAPANADPAFQIEPMELPSPNKIEAPKKSVPPPKANKPSPFPKSNTSKTKPNASPTLSLPPSPPAGGGGFLGLTLETAGGGGFGLSVVEIAPDSPAWKAGFRTGDRVIGVAGQAVSTVDAFAEQLTKFSPGSPVKFLVERRGRNANLVAVLQDRSVAGQIQGNRPGTAIDLAPPNVSSMPNSIGNGRPARAYFGVNVSDMSDGFRRQFAIPTYQGASVTEVVPQSPAAAAGLKPGDCIVELDGAAVQSAEGVMDKIMRAKPGQVITVSYYRGRQLTTASVPLISDAQDTNLNGLRQAISPEMLTPEYVAGLHGELERVNQELSQTQARLQELENRLLSLESKR